MTTHELLEDYRLMARIRAFEDRSMELYRQGEMPGLVHAYSGQEAVAVGVCGQLEVTDTITSTHRGHGHCIAKGVDLAAMMAENLGRASGVCAGKGGSMHIADVSKGILGANGIVGGGIGIALGAAFSADRLGEPRVSVSFLGDGAMNEGVVYEVMNMAALWSLPLVIVCEYNGFTEYTRSEQLIAGDLLARADAFGLLAREVDGQVLEAVREVSAELVDHARAGQGPGFLLARTHRFHGHHVAEFESGYRQGPEDDYWRDRDPLELLGARLQELGIDDAVLGSIVEEVGAELAQVVAQALAAPAPNVASLREDIVAEVSA